ncbi:hypothetical protein L21SP2_2115 [Salinispira pacifica]|uniref:Uncharacterized protein n=1 Tax=Salinispira pacifica TaxID=1307761 RepID=V5WI27_9SPIO|nr:hypothetical protein L21SP2_2115 [Salinispira pacifica]
MSSSSSGDALAEISFRIRISCMMIYPYFSYSLHGKTLQGY